MKFHETWDYLHENSKITSETKLSKGNKIIFAVLETGDYVEFLGIKAISSEADYTIRYLTGEVIESHSGGKHSLRTYNVRLDDGKEVFVERKYVMEKVE